MLPFIKFKKDMLMREIALQHYKQ